MVRIVSWNVNGLRSLQPSAKAALDALDADIICLQETKISQSDVSLERLALVEGYHSFFSFCTTRPGYSGVATYVRDSLASSANTQPASHNQSSGQISESRVNVIPVDAGQGLCNSVGGASVNWLEHVPTIDSPSAADILAQGVSYERIGHSVPVSVEDVDLIREEGRIVVTDHMHFVLFNIYAPAVSVEGRYAFKLAFNKALELKIRALRDAGRSVIVAGDFNICPSVLDRAETVSDVSSFDASPSRVWLRDVVCDQLGFVDSFRELHPKARDWYTCWSEATRARENNFGSRIDLIMVTTDIFRDDVLSASIMRDIFGSDHCPVGIDIRAQALSSYTLPTRPPPFCSKYLRRFSAKQTNMKAFLVQGDVPGVARGGAGCSAHVQIARGRPGQKAQRRISPKKAQGVSRKRSKRGAGQQLNIGQFVRASTCRMELKDGGEDPARVVDATAPCSSSKGPCFASPLREDGEGAGNTGEVLTQDSRESRQVIDEKDAEDEKAKKEWRRILSGPPAPPLCRHREPCKLKTVKKSGENRGRVFFSCNRPAGNWPLDRDANCNFFQWAR